MSQLSRSRKGMHSALSWPMLCSLPLQQGLGQQYAGVFSLPKSLERLYTVWQPWGLASCTVTQVLDATMLQTLQSTVQSSITVPQDSCCL